MDNMLQKHFLNFNLFYLDSQFNHKNTIYL